MVKRKNKLVVEPFDDIKVIGINTGMMDYQLAWYLNKTLKIQLAKYKSIANNSGDLFSFYLYDSGENSNTFNLVALSSEGKEWVSFKPKTDFIFIVRNYIKDADFHSMLTKIKNIPNIFHAYVIDLDINKKMDVILEDIEFHEMDIIDEINKSLRT
jgi:hypothetical protein